MGQAGRPERVPLGDQPAGRVDDPAPAVGGVAVVDQFCGFTFAVGVVRIITNDGSQKVRNIERDARATLTRPDWLTHGKDEKPFLAWFAKRLDV